MVLSDTTKDLIADLQLTAIRYNNEFIHTTHFLLVYNRYRQDDSDFKVSVTSLKNALLYNGQYKSGQEIAGSVQLTKVMERIIKRSDLQRKIFGYKKIEPRHLYLSMLIENGDKKGYFDWIKRRQIKLNLVQRAILNLLFTPLFKKSI